MTALLRFVVIALIVLHFLRRAIKIKNQGTVPPSSARRPSGRKNDFRDIPPPPENPELG